MNDDVEVGTGEDNYSWNKEGGSLKDVVLRLLRKITDISSQEMTESYWTEKPMKVGDTVAIAKDYHPDLREAYINAVDMLITLTVASAKEDDTGIFEERQKELQSQEDADYDKANTEDWSETDWTYCKLEYRKKILKEIMLMLDRINFFSGSDGGISE